jgi:transcription initiation factor TFIIB
MSHSSNEEYQSSPTNAEDLIRRFCSHLGLSSQITKAAEHIARRTRDEGILAGRSPISIAAAAIYMAAALFEENYSGIKISEHTGVSDGTIKTSYRYLWEARDKLIDKTWIDDSGASLDRLPKV